MATSSPKNKTLPTCHIVTCHLNESDAESIVQPILTAHPQLVLHQQRHAEELAATIHQILHSYNDRLLVLLVGAPPDKQQYEELLVHFEKQQSSLSSTFTCVLDPQRSADPRLRLQLADAGVNMVTGDVRSVSRVLEEVCSYLSSREVAIKSNGKSYSCPECGLSHLTEDDLWRHFPLYHINSKQEISICPVCNLEKINPGLHIHEKHGPPARGHIDSSTDHLTEFKAFSYVVVQRSDGKFLVVQEFLNQGYWLPAGRMNRGESFQQAAIREVKEETGIDIQLTGLINICEYPFKRYYHGGNNVIEFNVYFVGRPLDESQPVKTIPDYESAGACWVTIEELMYLKVRSNLVRDYMLYVYHNKPIQHIGVLDTFK